MNFEQFVRAHPEMTIVKAAREFLRLLHFESRQMRLFE